MSQLGAAYLMGMLATVNPCGFAMLPAFLAVYVGRDSHVARPRPLLAGLRAGAAVSAGFSVVFTVAGLLLALGLRMIVGAVPWAAVVIGALLVVLGTTLAIGRSFPAGPLKRLSPRRAPTGNGTAAMAAYGAAYAVASLSCSLALLLAVVAQALATGSLVALLSVFGAYALGASSLLVVLAVAAAFTREGLARSVRRVLPVAGRLGGVALLAAGLYLIAYWAPVLLGGEAGGSVSGMATALSTAATGAIESSATGIALAAGLALLLGGVVAFVRRTRVDHLEDCCAPPDSGPLSQTPGPEQEEIHR